MSESALQREIQKKDPFLLPEQEAYLNILRTESLLSAQFDRLFKEHGISSAQYNILRILRGNEAEGLPCQAIAQRMVTRVPDVTRLVDRLEKAGLAGRHRSREDRRIVRVQITEAGRELLARLDQPVLDVHQRLLGHMTRKELADINRLMAKARRSPHFDSEAGGT